MSAQLQHSNNNIIELSGEEFSEIILGWKGGYYEFGHTSVRESEGKAKAEQTGEPFTPESVSIPATSWIMTPPEYRIKYYSHKPNEQWPDPHKPLIYKIKFGVYLSKERPTLREHEDKKSKRLLYRPIRLTDCHFMGDLSLYETENQHYIYFNRCLFLHANDKGTNVAQIQLKKSTFNTVTFSECTANNYQEPGFLNELLLSSITAQKFTVERCRFNRLIVDTTAGDIANLEIIDSCIGEIEFIGDNLRQCTITNIGENRELLIKGNYGKLTINTKSENVLLNKSVIKNLKIELKNQDGKGSLVIANQVIENVYFTGISNGEIFIKDTQIANFTINDFSNLGSFRLHRVKEICEFTLQDASFGEADMMNLDLSKAKRIKIAQSSISDITLNNTVFPRNIIANDANDFSGIREVYRQLKYASNKQGNRIRELEYEAWEMEAYKKDSSIQKSFVDKVILATNEWSNNHGQDWSKALGLLIIFTWGTFFIIKYCQGYRLALVWPDFGQIAQYLNFTFNPLHNFDTLFNSSNDTSYWIGIAKFMDALTKIVSGYLLFQFIRAFRKFVK